MALPADGRDGQVPGVLRPALRGVPLQGEGGREHGRMGDGREEGLPPGRRLPLPRRLGAYLKEPCPRMVQAGFEVPQEG